MDPIEKKPTYSYPNADREAVDNKNSQPSNESGVNNSTGERPLFHLSDVLKEPTEKDAPYKTSSVHTFKDDMANEVSKGGFSVGKIMAANSKKIHSNVDNTVDISKKKSHIGVFFLILLICILIIAIFSYIGFKSAVTPQQISNRNNPTQQVVGNILYSEISFPIYIDGKNRPILTEDILKESSVAMPSGKIKSFIFNNNSSSTLEITSSEFLSIIAPGVPDVLLRNLKNEYVFGYYSFNSNEPFIILKSANYDSAFAGMLEWERNMYVDIGNLIYKKEKDVVSQASSTSSTTPAVSRPTYSNGFIDKVILNNDTRVLYKSNGDIAFFYTFFNKDTIIIATSEQTLKEIIYRLTSGKITR